MLKAVHRIKVQLMGPGFLLHVSVQGRFLSHCYCKRAHRFFKENSDTFQSNLTFYRLKNCSTVQSLVTGKTLKMNCDQWSVWWLWVNTNSVLLFLNMGKQWKSVEPGALWQVTDHVWGSVWVTGRRNIRFIRFIEYFLLLLSPKHNLCSSVAMYSMFRAAFTFRVESVVWINKWRDLYLMCEWLNSVLQSFVKKKITCNMFLTPIRLKNARILL